MFFFNTLKTSVQTTMRDSGAYATALNHQESPTAAAVTSHVVTYPASSTLSYAWNFGSLAGIFLAIQIFTGAFLSAFYNSEQTLAFDSVEIHIMRNVSYGWMIRYMHSNGASFYFALLYLHMARTIRFGSHVERPAVWNSGVVIYLLSMATAFLGYVLPWGQMSLWGATVITSLFTTLPFGIGSTLTEWIWGDYSVSGPALRRFYTFHFVLPFVVLAVVVLHIILLHRAGSSNPENSKHSDFISFFSYFFIKDVSGLWFVLFWYFIVVFWFPDFLGHPDNYKKANPLETPTHIVPEWYFLPFYAILRCVEDKEIGVALMFGSIICLFFLPLAGCIYNCSTSYQKIWVKTLFWLFALNFLVLGFLGAAEASGFYITVTRISTGLYFAYILIPACITLAQRINPKEDAKRIAQDIQASFIGQWVLTPACKAIAAGYTVLVEKLAAFYVLSIRPRIDSYTNKKTK